uniref:Protein SHQ1 homolog n=1 Tax=Anopheles christyi TaxID=43041 RepID=A0A182JSS7_9DIPT
MEDNLSFRTILESNHIAVLLDLPELDLEHESNLVLDIFPNECTFTAAPYHARIPLPHSAQPGKAFPESIDYEKSTVTFRVPLEVKAKTDAIETSSFPYGFCRFYSGPLALETSQELKVLPNPQECSFSQRWEMKEATEKSDFYGEHYGMDYIQFSIDKLGLDMENFPAPTKLTDEQSYRIRVIVEEKLRHKESYTSIEDHRTVLFGLIDIMLAVVYDQLTNSNELNEANSHINIHRISATLGYFAEFAGVEQMLRSFYRRSCTYPYYRNKNISLACVRCVMKRMSDEGSKEWMQRQLIHTYEAFKRTDCAVLNHYFIKDFIRYVEWGLNKETLLQCIEDIEKALPKIHEETLGFGEEKLLQKLLQDIIGQDESDSTDSDDEESSEDDSSESDSDNESIGTDTDTNPNENVLEKLMNLKLSG